MESLSRDAATGEELALTLKKRERGGVAPVRSLSTGVFDRTGSVVRGLDPTLRNPDEWPLPLRWALGCPESTERYRCRSEGKETVCAFWRVGDGDLGGIALSKLGIQIVGADAEMDPRGVLDFEGSVDTMNCSFRATWVSAGRRMGVEGTHKELDDGVVELFVLMVPCGLDHVKHVVDEAIVELGELFVV